MEFVNSVSSARQPPLDRQRRLGQHARRLELRNPARVDAQSIVRTPLATAAAIRADDLDIVVDVEHDLRAIEMGDQPPSSRSVTTEVRSTPVRDLRCDLGKDTFDAPAEQPVQLVHQVRADPQQLSAAARPRLVPPTEFAWTTLTGDHVAPGRRRRRCPAAASAAGAADRSAGYSRPSD